jgi:DNA-binding NarL/FixJ family response regulator
VEAMTVRARVYIWYGHHLFARVMEPVLRREGMDVLGVEGNPGLAVAAILRSAPDVVLTDRIVEREHGEGIAEIIRGSRRVRVLVLDLLEDEMRIYDGSGQAAGGLPSILKAIEETVQRPELPLAG